MADFIAERLELTVSGPDLSDWRRAGGPDPETASRLLNVALVGKYVELEDAYMSVREALRHAAWSLDRDVKIDWVSAESLEHPGGCEAADGAEGIVVPGGFGYRGIEGKIAAACYARENRHALPGTLPGDAGDVHRVRPPRAEDAGCNSTEFNPKTANPVISLMPDQQGIEEMGGTMRLGLCPCVLQPGTLAAEAYAPATARSTNGTVTVGSSTTAIVPRWARPAWSSAGYSPDGRLVEIAELDRENCIPGCWVPRRIRNFVRGRTVRTRSSWRSCRPWPAG